MLLRFGGSSNEWRAACACSNMFYISFPSAFMISCSTSSRKAGISLDFATAARSVLPPKGEDSPNMIMYSYVYMKIRESIICG